MKLHLSFRRLLCLVIATLFVFSMKNDLSAGAPRKSDSTGASSQPRPLPFLKRVSHISIVPEAKQAAFHNKPLFYDQPSRVYNLWRKPNETSWTAGERCKPRPFCPRGYGDLNNKRGDCYRLDYHRYVIRDPNTSHGPSYYVRPTEPERCCEVKGDGCECDTCRTKKPFKLFR